MRVARRRCLWCSALRLQTMPHSRPSSNRECGWGRPPTNAILLKTAPVPLTHGLKLQSHSFELTLQAPSAPVRRVRYVTVDAGPQLQAQRECCPVSSSQPSSAILRGLQRRCLPRTFSRAAASAGCRCAFLQAWSPNAQRQGSSKSGVACEA